MLGEHFFAACSFLVGAGGILAPRGAVDVITVRLVCRHQLVIAIADEVGATHL